MFSQIIVTGCPRTGTSMVAGILHLAGAFVGDTGKPTQYNAKGFFENLRIREEVIKPLLRKLGIDDKGQDILNAPYEFPADVVKEHADGIRRSVLAIFKEEGWDESGFQSWLIKEPKITLVWQFFREAFPCAVWVTTNRYVTDTVEECLQTPFLKFFKDRDGWRKWVTAYRIRLDKLREFCVKLEEFGEKWHRVVRPQSFVQGRLEGRYHAGSFVGQLLQWAGCDPTDSAFYDCLNAAEKFVDPSLWPFHTELNKRDLSKLRKCPYCERWDHKDELTLLEDDGNFRLYCVTCGLKFPKYPYGAESKEGVIRDWNEKIQDAAEGYTGRKTRIQYKTWSEGSKHFRGAPRTPRISARARASYYRNVLGRGE